MDNNISSSETKNKDMHIKTKIEKYDKERKEIITKLFEIINVQIEDKLRFFYSDEITEDKQNEILNMRNEIKRYFVVNGWISFKNTVKLDKIYMSLIRNILKHEKINYIICQKMIKGTRKTKYIFYDNNEDIK